MKSGDPVPPGDLERVFLLPGELHVTRKPAYLATLLGSCVAVCLRNTKTGHAAMNHFVRDCAGEAGVRDIGRFGDLSTRYIIEKLFAFDPVPSHYEAKLFGGGNVVSHLGAGLRIGSQNIAVARRVLEENRIKVVRSDVGGTRGRKIYFNTADFDITVRPIGEEKKDFSSNAVRVLIVDDSSLVRGILSRAVGMTDGMEVCGQARDAFEARDLIVSENPDVVSLDIVMPRLDGLKFLEKLMKFSPKPVVIVSTIAKDKSDIARKALKLGAAGVIDKDTLEIYKGLEVLNRQYIPLLRAAASANVKRTIL